MNLALPPTLILPFSVAQFFDHHPRSISPIFLLQLEPPLLLHILAGMKKLKTESVNDILLTGQYTCGFVTRVAIGVCSVV